MHPLIYLKNRGYLLASIIVLNLALVFSGTTVEDRLLSLLDPQLSFIRELFPVLPNPYEGPYFQSENWENFEIQDQELILTPKEDIAKSSSVITIYFSNKMCFPKMALTFFKKIELENDDLAASGVVETPISDMSEFHNYRYENVEGKIEDFFNLFFQKKYIPPFIIDKIADTFTSEKCWCLPLDNYIIQDYMRFFPLNTGYCICLYNYIKKIKRSGIDIKQISSRFMLYIFPWYLSQDNPQLKKRFISVFSDFVNFQNKKNSLSLLLLVTLKAVQAELCYLSFESNESAEKMQRRKRKVLDFFSNIKSEDETQVKKIKGWSEKLLKEILQLDELPNLFRDYLSNPRKIKNILESWIAATQYQKEENNALKRKIANLEQENRDLKKRGQEPRQIKEEQERYLSFPEWGYCRESCEENSWVNTFLGSETSETSSEFNTDKFLNF